MTKHYAILGATGTLGNELASQLLAKDDTGSIVCFSRDELKQKEMKARFDHDPRLRFMLGDIRDKDSLRRAIRGVHAIFHVAAYKHVEVCEENPEESVKTNILGTINVADLAEEMFIPHVIFSSTDKAVDPINVYGMCKGISEKILLHRNVESFQRFKVYRWGNVIGSRGSIVHTFADQLKKNSKIPITDLRMTRFWIPIERAVKFMLDTYEVNSSDEVRIPPYMRAAQVSKIADSVARVLNMSAYGFKTVGIRPGEKIHESLTSIHSEKAHLCSKTVKEYDEHELDQMVSSILGQAGHA